MVCFFLPASDPHFVYKKDPVGMSDTSPALEALVVALHEIGAVKVCIPLALFRDHPLSIDFPFSERRCLSCSGMPVALRARVLAQIANRMGSGGFHGSTTGNHPSSCPHCLRSAAHDLAACGVHRDLRSLWVLSRACPPRRVRGLLPAAIPRDLSPFWLSFCTMCELTALARTTQSSALRGLCARLIFFLP